jgi:ATP-dependent helicase/nuclease subunit A
VLSLIYVNLYYTITQLDALKIKYQGLDTDLTTSLTHVKDIWSIIQALLMPTHRLAWLSVLRSPWCGLSLADLHCIANHAPKQSILSALVDSDCIHQLTATGQIRVRFISTILNQALKTRYQEPLVIWILNTLKSLHLEAILNSAEILDLSG